MTDTEKALLELVYRLMLENGVKIKATIETHIKASSEATSPEKGNKSGN